MASPLILRTNNPAEFLLASGVYIDEQVPPGRVIGRPTGVVGIVGQFERGPTNAITLIGSTKQFTDIFGGYGGVNAPIGGYPGYGVLVNKRFGALRIVRVAPSDIATASSTAKDSGNADSLAFTANSAGVWGNEVTRQVLDPTDPTVGDFNVRIRFRSRIETWRNLKLTTLPADGASQIVNFSKVGSNIPVVDADPVALANGDDGTIADADYTGTISVVAGIRVFEVPNDVNFLIADRHTAAVNDALAVHAAEQQDKMVIIAGLVGQTVAEAISDVSQYRTDRAAYVFPYLKTTVPDSGLVTLTAPDAWVAASLARLGVIQSPAQVECASKDYIAVQGLELPDLTRNDYVALKAAGIDAFIFDPDIGYFLREGVTTSLDSSLLNITRRRTTDYLENSMSFRLRFFKSKVNKRDNHIAIKAEIQAFLASQQGDTILTDQEAKDISSVTGGRVVPFLIDIDTANTAEVLASNEFIVVVYVRIYGSMDAIVLRPTIGENVTVIADPDRLAA